jgi:hypothetical protein
MSQNLATAMPTGSDKFDGGDGLARESNHLAKSAYFRSGTGASPNANETSSRC